MATKSGPVRGDAPLDITPTRWTFACIDCKCLVETDSDYLRSLERCGGCLAEREAEALTDLERDENPNPADDPGLISEADALGERGRM
jgi:hypothetical protein